MNNHVMVTMVLQVFIWVSWTSFWVFSILFGCVHHIVVSDVELLSHKFIRKYGVQINNFIKEFLSFIP